MTMARHRVVIVGGGFGGLHAAQALRAEPVEVVLVDRQNYHLFQPLLYQVATGGLSGADSASPLRWILRRQRNTSVLLGEVVDIDAELWRVKLRDGEPRYDSNRAVAQSGKLRCSGFTAWIVWLFVHL
jgi:NADH dehydrogenase